MKANLKTFRPKVNSVVLPRQDGIVNSKKLLNFVKDFTFKTKDYCKL